MGAPQGMGSKKRPALILSRENHHGGRQESVVAAITSNVRRVLPGDTKIVHWETAGLKFPSLVSGLGALDEMRPEKITRSENPWFLNVRLNFWSHKMSPVQSNQKVASGFDGCGQHRNVLGMNMRFNPEQYSPLGWGHNNDLTLLKIPVKGLAGFRI